VPLRKLLPGSIAGGIAWTLLQALGTYLVHRFLHSDSVYGVFATVLGLLAWVYLAVEVSVYAAEVNVVLSRRLWPRGMIQPPLTEADRSSMALQALQNQRRPEQHVEVTYNDRPAEARPVPTTPETPAEVAPPAPGDAAQKETAQKKTAQQETAQQQAAEDRAQASGGAPPATVAPTGGPTPAPAAHTSAPGPRGHA
jgi:hypothetical protein